MNGKIDADLPLTDGSDHSATIKTPSPFTTPQKSAQNWLLNGRPTGITTAATTTTTSTSATTNDSSSSSGPPLTPPSPLPYSHVSTIKASFGRNDSDDNHINLYTDVLGLSQDEPPSPRGIRIAYFRKGREVLSEQSSIASRQEAAPSSKSVGGSEVLPKDIKLRFQAVSMAYELLSNPVSRAYYDQYGLVAGDPSDDSRLHDSMEESQQQQQQQQPHYVLGGSTSYPDTPSMPADDSGYYDDFSVSVKSTPILRGTGGSVGGGSSSNNGVRWCEEVEELVFAKDPQELEPRDLFGIPRKPRRPGRRRRRRQNRPRVLVETDALQQHLEQLDKQAEKHFVSDLMDDIESSIEELLSLGSGSKDKDDTEQTNKNKQKKKAIVAAKDRNTDEAITATGGRKTDTATITTNITTTKTAHDNRSVVSAPARTVASLDPSTPSDKYQQRQKKYMATVAAVTDPAGGQSPDDEEIRDNNDKSNREAASSQPRQPQQQPQPDTEPMGFNDGFDLWCGQLDQIIDDGIQRSTSTSTATTAATTATAESRARDAGTGSSSPSSTSPGFHVFLMSYLQSLADDLYSAAEVVQQSVGEWNIGSMMDPILISEDDLEGMLGILKRELQQDEKETRSTTTAPRDDSEESRDNTKTERPAATVEAV